MLTSSDMQEIREEVVKALGQACKSPSDSVARAAFAELQKIEAMVFKG